MTQLVEVKAELISDKIERTLFRRIVDGEYRPGDTLPGVDLLAAEFQVSRNTISSALRRLSASGYLATPSGHNAKVLDVMHGADFRVLCRVVRTPKSPVRGLEVHGHLLEWLNLNLSEMAQCAALSRGTDHLYWLRHHLTELESQLEADASVETLGECHHQLWWLLAAASQNLAYTVLVNTAKEYLAAAEATLVMSLPEWREVLHALVDKDPFSARRTVDRAFRRRLLEVLGALATAEGR